MRKYLIAFALAVTMATPAFAQHLNLDFPGLAERAEEVVDITLDADMLRMAARFFGNKTADDRALRDMINGLEGIYVRSFTFTKEGEYDRGLADRVRTQLGSTWKPLVTVKSKSKENVNILADMRGDKIMGLVIISAEPREFTVVSIVGPVDIERLSALEGQFGIPRVTTGGKDNDRD
ncbi:MAG: hypothetical protein QOH21_1135 [Acidobacteriota bacterium]|jgi:hypothetical protein|nr:hypothetical protein [Acidobacteriota bacterium]